MLTRRFKLLDNSVLLLLSLASVLHCALADGKTLVLLDNLNIKDTHSIFFRSLAGQYDNTIFLQLYLLCYAVLYMPRLPGISKFLAANKKPLLDQKLMHDSKNANISLAVMCSRS